MRLARWGHEGTTEERFLLESEAVRLPDGGDLATGIGIDANGHIHPTGRDRWREMPRRLDQLHRERLGTGSARPAALDRRHFPKDFPPR